MTNLEILQSTAGLNYPLEEVTYIATLVQNDLDPNGEFTSANQKGIDLSKADLILTLLSSVKKLMDDGYSIEAQDIADLWRLRWYWRNKWGLPDDEPVKPFPTLSGRSTNKW